MQGGERTQTLDESLLTDTEERDQPVVEFVGSTPGRMALIAIALIATVLAVGVTASTTIADRRDRLETMRLHTEPLADAAQRIYGALSIANTAATTAFLSGGIEPQDVRDRTTRRSAKRRPVWSLPRTAWRPTTFTRSRCSRTSRTSSPSTPG